MLSFVFVLILFKIISVKEENKKAEQIKSIEDQLVIIFMINEY
jgi:hypothetical protein